MVQYIVLLWKSIVLSSLWKYFILKSMKPRFQACKGLLSSLRCDAILLTQYILFCSHHITIFRAWFGSNEALSFASSLAYFSVRQNWFFYVSLLQRFLILMTDSLSLSQCKSDKMWIPWRTCCYRHSSFLVHDSIDITECRTMSHENDQNYDY